VFALAGDGRGFSWVNVKNEVNHKNSRFFYIVIYFIILIFVYRKTEDYESI